MACRSCSRRSGARKSSSVTAPDIVNDFTLIGPSQVKIRSGNGQQYSITSPLTKMRPPSGWSLWVMVNGHKHFIEGNSASEVVNGVIQRYATNDIDIDYDAVWFNANRIWVSKMSARHTYATNADLRAITVSLTDPLIWNSEEWDKIKELVQADVYDPDATKTELFRLFALASHKVTGCE